MQKKPIASTQRHDINIPDISRKDLKSIFYILSGMPDSTLKVFDKAFILRFDDLIELNQKIGEKLEHYQTDAVKLTVDVSFDGGLSKHFNNLADMKAAVATCPEKTEAITLRWDFLVALPIYPVPQRHTVTVRAATAMKPAQMLRYALSRDPEEDDKLEYDMAPLFCRVDFVNHLLSQELINRVSEWYNGRAKPLVYSSIFNKLRRFRQGIANVIHYSLPATVTVVACFILPSLFGDSVAGNAAMVSDLRLASLWLLVSGVAVYASKLFSFWLASTAYQALQSFGKFGAFSLTNGDTNNQSELEQANRDKMSRFILSFCGTLAIHIVAGLVVAFVLHH